MPNSSPTVSVVIPAYNAATTLPECLAALKAQDYPRELLEVIVVDDGSRDNTLELIQASGFRALHQTNAGPATARNHGAREAGGEILLFTDADCVPTPAWVTEMTQPFAETSVMAVKGSYITQQPQLVARFAQIEFEERFDLLEQVDSIDMVDTYAAGFRRALFLAMGGFDTSFPKANNEDTELSYRLASQGHRMVFNRQAVVRHLNHPDGVMRYGRLKFGRGYWRMVVYKRHPGKMAKDTYTPQTLKLQILALLALTGSLPITLLWPPAWWGMTLPLLLLFLTLCLPFTLRALKRDLAVGMAAPLLLALRAGALGSGALWGVVHPHRP